MVVLVVVELLLLVIVLDSIRPIPTPPITPASSPSKTNVGKPSRMDLLLLGLVNCPSRQEWRLIAIVARWFCGRESGGLGMFRFWNVVNDGSCGPSI